MNEAVWEEHPKDIEKLETHIDELIDICSQLHIENKSLKKRQDSLITERSSLIQKNDLARERVDAMISRLKAMEITHE